MHAESIRFSHFELQPRERRLLVRGEPAALGARAFDVLLALVERAGSLVTKNELLERVWAGLVVEEANLTVQVSGLRKVLGSELIATIPGRGYRFTGQLVPATGATAAPVAAPPTPPVRPVAAPALVGRAAELERIAAALAQPGCVTLVGPAGVGKTSLARAAAAAWPGGALWVYLAPLTEGAQVLEAMARALGQPTPEAAPALLPALGARLLVLDNAEHLIDAVATVVASLLAADPGLALLVTCQLPLSVPGERVQRVEPLALGDGGEGGALALFIERARAADHRFVAGAAQLPLLRAICRQLDGLPLAIEMAAARVPALGLQGLHDALQQRFAVLTRGARTAAERHRTLHAALDWSYALLQPEEQRVFRALGVFAGGFTLELAVSLAQDQALDRWALIDTLASLVDRSLVVADGADMPRYRLLETMRAYALSRLEAAGEAEAVRGRHAEALAALYEAAAGPAASEADRSAALAEHDNVRQALVWARQQRPALAVALGPRVAALATFQSWRNEAAAWLEELWPALDSPEVGDAARAAWWHQHARQLMFGRRAGTREAAQRARTLYVALGDAEGAFHAGLLVVRASRDADAELAAHCTELQREHDANPAWQPRSTLLLHGALAVACRLAGDHARRLDHRLAELAAARQLGSPAAVNSAEANVITALQFLGRDEEALVRCDAMLRRLEGCDNLHVAYAVSNRVASLVQMGRHDDVRADAPRALSVMRRYDVPFIAEHWAMMLAREGRHEAAAYICGYAMRRYEECGMVPDAENSGYRTELEAAVTAALGERAWPRALAHGRSLDEAGVLVCLAPGEA